MLKKISVLIAAFIFIALLMCHEGLPDYTKLQQETMENDISDEPSERFLDIYATAGEAASARTKLFLKDNRAYLFLASYMQPDEIVLSFDDNAYAVSINGEHIANGDSLRDDQLKGCIEVNSVSYPFECLKSENVPAFFIYTDKGSTSEIDSDITKSDRGLFIGFDEAGNEDNSGYISKLKARGNSSFQADKKTYRIKLEKKAALFGMNSEKSFILQANAYDNTNIRNILAYDLARKLGISFTPDLRTVDLYIDDEYRGNYIILESIKVGSNRVNIDKQGSYLFETVHREDRLKEGNEAFLCGGKVFLQINYPQKPTDAQYEYALKHMNMLDGRIKDLGREDSLEELSAYMNLDSFAREYLMDFISNDIDSGNYSTFYYYDGSDHLVHAGPVWDYDKAWGNELKKNGRPDFDFYSCSWPQLLSDNQEFRNTINDIWTEERDNIYALMDEGLIQADIIRASYEMDIARNGAMGSQSVNEGSLDDNVKWLLGYIDKRLELFESVNKEPEMWCQVYIREIGESKFWIRKGEAFGDDRILYLKKLYHSDSFLLPDGSPVTEATIFNENSIVFPEAEYDELVKEYNDGK